MRDIIPFPYIRQEARQIGIPECELRRMLCRGELPGFYVGEKQLYFRVDHAALVELLREKSVGLK